MAFSIATVFQCTPIAGFWDHSIKGAKCFSNEPWWISYATVQITTDFALLFMPFRQILKLTMGTTEKLGIALVFGTGGLYVPWSIYPRHCTNATKRHFCIHLSGYHDCKISHQPRSNPGPYSRDDMVSNRSKCRHHLRLSAHAPCSVRAGIRASFRLAHRYQG